MFKTLAIRAIQLYQKRLSKRRCWHGTKLNEEHCSDYGIRAISENGLLYGGLKTAARIVSCSRKDADDYVAQGGSSLDLVKLIVDAVRFKRISRVRGKERAVALRDIGNLFYSGNWLNASSRYRQAGQCDPCCGCDGDTSGGVWGSSDDDEDDAEDGCCMD